MKFSRRGCAILAILLAGAMLVAALAAYYVLAIVPRTLEERRTASGPPTILVRTPASGDTFPAESQVSAGATASGMNPISEVQLWVDGNLVSTLVPELPDQTTYHALTSFPISEGTHILSWRVVDSAGLVAQTLPITIAGSSRSTGGEPGGPADAQGDGPQGNQGEEGGFQAPQGGQAGPGDQPDPQDGAGQGPQVDQGGPGVDPPPMAWVAHEVPAIDWGKFLGVTLTLMPESPSELQVGFNNCRVQVTWNDNADNESHFIVWMQALGGPPVVVRKLAARPQTGQTWFEFDAPPFGIYSIWVEAANALGGQASEIQGVAVNRNCSEEVATHLEIEALQMEVSSDSWENVYCYLSLEGAPEERIPGPGNYLELDDASETNLHAWIGGQNRRLIPIPSDGELSIDGKCMGWLGGGPQPMGFFSERIPMAHWDNRALIIESANFRIAYRVRTHVFSGGEGVYEYIDEDIPTPIITAVEVEEGTTPGQNALFAQYPTVIFAWEGNPEITGFTLYIDGTPHYEETTPAPFQAFFKRRPGPLPTQCGGTYEFRVAANSGQARSDLSNPWVYEQPTCGRFAELTFDGYLFAWLTGETASACRSAEVRVNIFTNDYRKGSPNWMLPIYAPIPTVECNQRHEFRGIPEAHQFLSIDPKGDQILVYIEFHEMDDILGTAPSYSPICTMRKDYPIRAMSNEEWATFRIDGAERCPNVPMDKDGSGTVYFTIKGVFGAQ